MKVIKTAAYKTSQYSGDETYGDDITSGPIGEPNGDRPCSSCGQGKPDVERRHSYGIYAGILCNDCAYRKYRDHCGLVRNPDGSYVEGNQGDQRDLEEMGEVIDPEPDYDQIEADAEQERHQQDRWMGAYSYYDLTKTAEGHNGYSEYEHIHSPTDLPGGFSALPNEEYQNMMKEYGEGKHRTLCPKCGMDQHNGGKVLNPSNPTIYECKCGHRFNPDNKM